MFSNRRLILAAIAIIIPTTGCDAPDEIDFDNTEVLDAEPAPPSELTLEQLSTLPYDELEPGVFVHEGDGFSVEVERGFDGAKHYQKELELTLAEVEEFGTPEALADAEELRDELIEIEELLDSNNWDVNTTRANVSSSVCGIQYDLSYKIIPTFFHFTLETTATTRANLISPKPPFPRPGQIKAKSIINYETPYRIQDVSKTDFGDTWAQVHEAIASAKSSFHPSEDLQTWKAAAVLTSTGNCTGFERIIVTGKASWAGPVIVDSTSVF